MENILKFTEHYHERVRLSGDKILLLRLVRPDDKERLHKGFRNLSPHSRHKRFFATKESLTNEELDYYTEIDQDKHFALGVVELNERGEEGDGVGVARFIRYPDDATSAEVAVTVIDRMQGKGIGRIMLQKLFAAAAERNIRKLRFECLPHNREMQKLIRSVCEVVSFTREAGIMVAETIISDQYPIAYEYPLLAIESAYNLIRDITSVTLELQFYVGRSAINYTLDTIFDRPSV